MRIKTLRLSINFTIILCLTCDEGAGPNAQPTTPVGRSEYQVLSPRGGGGLDRTSVTVYTPPGEIRADVLVLPGWDHARTRYLNETAAQQLAEQYGFRLICPEMGRTVYASAYYPETTYRWLSKPGLAWLREDMWTDAKTRGFFADPEATFVLGISTGARGAALFALADGERIAAAALLSGDFDQAALPRDRLMTAAYGSYADFSDRWEGEDNPQRRVTEWGTPVFIAHGTNDRIVPFSQSEAFHDALKAAHPNLAIKLESPAAGHDYSFWDDMTGPAFEFFAQHADSE